jgi:hypothetical protein
MGKQQPAGTVSRTLFLPEELHRKVTSMARHGEADILIIDCLEEAIKPRWAAWLKEEQLKVAQKG